MSLGHGFLYSQFINFDVDRNVFIYSISKSCTATEKSFMDRCWIDQMTAEAITKRQETACF